MAQQQSASLEGTRSRFHPSSTELNSGEKGVARPEVGRLIGREVWGAYKNLVRS